jgi:actin-related protein 5
LNIPNSLIFLVVTDVLFGTFRVPEIVFGVDGVFSYYQSGLSMSEGGLVIVFGHNSTHLIPILGGKWVPAQTKRFVCVFS